VGEHGPVHFSQYVISHLQHKVRTDSDDVGVKRSVVQLAERQAIGDQGFTEGMAVRENMCSIEKLLVAEPAHGAGTLVGGEHTFSECGLVDTLASQSCDVKTTRLVTEEALVPDRRWLRIIDCYREAERCRIVSHYQGRPVSKVPPGHES
jgi:hypothetical protein